MAIGDKKKKTLFKDEPVMAKRKKRLTVTEADGGYIVGEMYDDNQKVCKTLAAVVKALKETFSEDKSADSEEE